MKKIIVILFCILSFTTAFAIGNKDKKKEANLNVNIHIDKKGDITLDGKLTDLAQIEKIVNEQLNNLSITVNDSSNKKGKNIKVKVKITDK